MKSSRIKERQAKMMQVQTNREYQSLLKEIEDGKKSIKEKEEEVVRIMEASEADAKIMAEQESLTKEEKKGPCRGKCPGQRSTPARVEGKKAKILARRDAMAKEIKSCSPAKV